MPINEEHLVKIIIKDGLVYGSYFNGDGIKCHVFSDNFLQASIFHPESSTLKLLMGTPEFVDAKVVDAKYIIWEINSDGKNNVCG